MSSANVFPSVQLLDETAILACAAYVDLNPIRAAMAETSETSSKTLICIFDNDKLSFRIRQPSACRNAFAFGPWGVCEGRILVGSQFHVPNNSEREEIVE